MPAANGTAVTVIAANGATCGTAAVGAAPASGSSYVVDLTGNDPGCNTAGDPLSFTVGGTNATAASAATVPDFSGGLRADLSVGNHFEFRPASTP